MTTAAGAHSAADHPFAGLATTSGNPEASVPAAGENEVHRQRQRLREAFAGTQLEPVYPPGSAAAACLVPLLMALKWFGEERHFTEALPYLENITDLEALRGVLARLNYLTVRSSRCLERVSDDQLPCLYQPDNGNVCVIIEWDREGRLLIFDGRACSFRFLDGTDTAGVVFLFEPRESRQSANTSPQKSWLFDVFHRFRPTLISLAAVSFASNAMALLVPIFVMVVYDRVVPTRSAMTLFYLVAGAGIVLLGDHALRRIRSRALAYFGARLESLISIAAIERLLFMPIHMTETAPVTTQIGRLRRFEAMRDLFIGPLATALFDFPFLILALITIAIIGGPIVWVPLTLVFALTLLGAATVPANRRRQQTSSEALIRHREALVEVISQNRTIRELGAEAIWIERQQKTASAAALAQFRLQQLSNGVQTTAQAVGTIAGVATMGVGAMLALDGAISVGALIAIVALVWRVMAPIQAAFVGFRKINQAIDSARQIDHLMRLPLERQPGELPTIYRRPVGQVSFAGVSFRYSSKSEAALAGVSLEIAPGELVAITGRSGGGKSTFLKMIVGLYQAPVGSVMIDGLDVRQFDTGELRHSVAFAPQSIEFFHGTVSQNLRFANPLADDEDLRRALTEVNALESIDAMPDGLETRLVAGGFATLPVSLRRQLSLARVFLKDAPIVLLDEPASGLDPTADMAFVKKLKTLKGRSTVIMVTHRPSHIQLADRVIVLDRGAVVANGPVGQVVSSSEPA